MGMRAQVKIIDTGVFLYTHWGSESLPDVVRETIKQGWRLQDPQYFTRILFEKMIDAEDGRGTETGFGIGTNEHSDLEYPAIAIYLSRQTVFHDGRLQSFEDFVNRAPVSNVTEPLDQLISDWPAYDPDPHNCRGLGQKQCLLEGRHTWFNHAVDKRASGGSNLPTGFTEPQ